MKARACDSRSASKKRAAGAEGRVQKGECRGAVAYSVALQDEAEN